MCVELLKVWNYYLLQLFIKKKQCAIYSIFNAGKGLNVFQSIRSFIIVTYLRRLFYLLIASERSSTTTSTHGPTHKPTHSTVRCPHRPHTETFRARGLRPRFPHPCLNLSQALHHLSLETSQQVRPHRCNIPLQRKLLVTAGPFEGHRRSINTAI